MRYIATEIIDGIEVYKGPSDPIIDPQATIRAAMDALDIFDEIRMVRTIEAAGKCSQEKTYKEINARIMSKCAETLRFFEIPGNVWIETQRLNTWKISGRKTRDA
jgi:hypothetical protein